jgi:RNA polymerase sigma-70 factor, ECF subfamily
LEEIDQQSRFEQTILPHLDAAYNLARWLTRNDHDAEDVAQDALLRAYKYFGGFRGGSSRSWLLSIVRNTCYNWLEKNRKKELGTVFDEEIHVPENENENSQNAFLTGVNKEMIMQAIEALPVEFREIVVLRELEDLSYKEIADTAGVPIGTVMSRLARARKQLQKSITQQLQAGGRK